MNYVDPLSYIEDEDRQKYDPALKPLAPRPKMEYTPPVTTGTNLVEPPQVEAPQMPAQSAGPQMPGWRTADDARESTRAALNADEELKQTIANRPRLQHAKGWKGALQTVGEMFLDPAVIHPNYTRQMQEYGQDVGVAEARAKIAANQAEQQRKQAQAEAQGSHYAKQEQTEEMKQAQIDYQMRHPKQPAPTVLSPGARAIDPLTGRVIGEGGPMKPMAPTREEMDEAGTARRMKEADQMGLKGPDRINYIAGRNVIRPPKTGRDGGQASQKDFRVIEANKNSAMLKAKVAAQREEAKIKANKDFLVTPEQKQEEIAKVWANYNDQMEQIQNGYESNILAAGGSIAPRQPAATEPPAAKAAPAALPAPVPNETVVNGYKYVGGNPNDKASWVPVK